MIIARFQGEMLHSHAIRYQRLEGGELGITDAFFPICDGRLMTSLRLPLPCWPCEELPSAMLYTWYDATVWPLWSLLAGCYLFDFASKRRATKFGKDLIRESHVKFCVCCAREQRQIYSVSWWTKDHNLPLIAVCPKHGVPLNAVATEDLISNRLPHELIEHSRSVISKADDNSIEIAQVTAALCEASYRIDTRTALAVALENKVIVSDSAIFRRALGSSAEYVLDGTHFRYQPLCNEKGLDQFLACLVLNRNVDIVSTLQNASALPYPFGPEIITNAIEHILSRCFHGCRNIRLELIKKHCRQWLSPHPQVQEPWKFSEISLVCFEFLLAFLLDRRWLNEIVTTFDLPDNCLYPISEWRCRAGMYILQVAFNETRDATARRPDVQALILKDQIIPEWNDSFLGKCAERADWFVANITGDLFDGFPQSRTLFAASVAEKFGS